MAVVEWTLPEAKYIEEKRLESAKVLTFRNYFSPCNY